MIDILVRLSLILYPLKLQLFLQRQLEKVSSGRLLSSLRHGKQCKVHGPITIFHGENICIGDDCELYDSVILASHPESGHDPCLEIGSHCTIGADTHITCAGYIKIGNNVLTGRRCTITDNSHGNTQTKSDLEEPPRKRALYYQGKVEIGDNVWLGDNVVVLPGVTIGNNAVIGASSVVTADVPPYSVAVGNPAKIIKQLG